MIHHVISAKLRFALAAVVTLSLVGCGSREDRAKAYYESGTKLLTSNSFQKAAVEFRNALKLKNDWMPALRGLAEADRAIHDWSGLVSVLHSILVKEPGDNATRIELAKILLAGGEVGQARNVVDQAVDPPNPDILALKGVILLQLKDNGAAIREAQAALALQSNNVDALKVLAAERLDADDPRGALQVLSRGPQDQDSVDVGLQMLRVKTYERLHNMSEVETLLRTLAEKHPQQIAFRGQLIKFYVDQHRLGDAEDELRTLATAEPSNSGVELELIRLLDAEKGHQAARAEIATRISAGGDIFPYQMALADIEYKEGNDGECFGLLKRLIQEAGSPDRVLAAKLKLARFNLGRKHFDVAYSLVTEVLGDDSFGAGKIRADALKLRAAVQLGRDQPDAAIPDLLEALNTESRSPDLMVLLAAAYERAGSISRADTKYAEALRISNEDVSVAFGYVAFLLRRGNDKRAEEILSDLAKHEPNNVRVLVTLAEVKLRLKDWSAAQQLSQSIRRLDENAPIADQLLGEALSGQGNSEGSIAALQIAVAKAPEAAQPMNLLVKALVRANKTEKAVSFLESVLRANPKNADAYVLLGSIQLARNNPAGAISNYMRAVSTEPRSSVGYRALAELYMRQNRSDEAQEVVRAGLKEVPNSVVLHMTLGGMLEQVTDYEGAIREYEWVMSQQPDSLIAVNNLASLLADHRNDSGSLARAQLLAARLRGTDVPQFKDTLGWISYRRNDTKDALPLLEAAAAALPNQAAVHYHLGVAYLAIGKSESANAEFRIARDKSSDKELLRLIQGKISASE